MNQLLPHDVAPPQWCLPCKPLDLDYMRRRFHSRHLGRFFSPDELKRYEPLRPPQLYNRYSYVVGDPVKLVDPDGLRRLRATELQFFNAFFGADFSTVDVRVDLMGRAVTSALGAGGVTLGETVFLSPDNSQRVEWGALSSCNTDIRGSASWTATFRISRSRYCPSRGISSLPGRGSGGSRPRRPTALSTGSSN